MPMVPREPIVAGDIGDQARLRPGEPACNLDEFLELLGLIEPTFGRTERPRHFTTGECFGL